MKMKKWFAIALALVLGTSLFACAKKTDEGAYPKKVRVGTIRIANDKTVAESMGYLKEAFAEKGIEVEVLFFDSGTAANVAFAAGAIDFAGMGYTNSVVALSKQLNVELIWIHEILGEAEALVAKEGRGISSIADLKGKKVATPFSSTSHLSLTKALELNGLKAQDVTLLDMNTEDIVAAWGRGDLDAAYTWEPTLSHLKKDGRVLVTSKELAEKGIKTVNVDLVNKAFSSRYPDLVALYVRTLSKGAELYQTKPEEAIAAAAKHLGISQEEARSQMAGTIWLNRQDELSDELLGIEDKPGQFRKIFADTADFLFAEKKIDRVPSMEEIDQFLNSSYIEQALQLP